MNIILINARKQSGLTLKEIAEKSNISQRQYYRLEAGTSKPRIIVAGLIAKTLNSTIEELFLMDN